ncbi:hypothetical protein M0R45_008443 [Rubus argutus]|uniref:Ribosome-binding factor A, chloroplastic n=1 Tax=Rubus argutus TaxID=59490 RepID=A0AAW1Y425_RUBAR
MPSFVLHNPPLASFSCHLPSSSSRFPIQTTQKSAAWIHPRNSIRCMAKPRRVAMVAKQIQRELSDMLLTDKVLQYAILPEVSLGADRYLSSLTTISDVEVSTDLQVVKVFVSVFGDERGKEVALAWAKVKSKVYESLERGSRVIAILDRIKNENKDEEQLESSELPQDDKDWEGDDPDEDIIYIK